MESDERTDLELRKLALEIADMERPWWKRPGYILAALPTLLAVIALSVGFLNGFFSAQLTKLENQRHDLEGQIRDFEAKRTELNTENSKLRESLNKKRADIREVQHEVRAISFKLVIAPLTPRTAKEQLIEDTETYQMLEHAIGRLSALAADEK